MQRRVVQVVLLACVLVFCVASAHAKRAYASKAWRTHARDTQCTSAGGTCMNPAQCTGTVRYNLCSGGADRRCCFPAGVAATAGDPAPTAGGGGGGGAAPAPASPSGGASPEAPPAAAPAPEAPAGAAPAPDAGGATAPAATAPDAGGATAPAAAPAAAAPSSPAPQAPGGAAPAPTGPVTGTTATGAQNGAAGSCDANKPSGPAAASSVTMPLPPRPANAPTGSAFAQSLGINPAACKAAYTGPTGQKLSPTMEASIIREFLSGNTPDWMRRYQPITLSGGGIRITLQISPDYLSVGSNADYVRFPLSAFGAMIVTSKVNAVPPTKTIVQAAFAQGKVKPMAKPQPPGAPMTGMCYIYFQNNAIQCMLPNDMQAGALVGGHKKEVVISGSCVSTPQTLDFYGWYLNNKAIQRNRFHESHYADYSHGIRFVHKIATVNENNQNTQRNLADLLMDPKYANILNAGDPYAQNPNTIDLRRCYIYPQDSWFGTLTSQFGSWANAAAPAAPGAAQAPGAAPPAGGATPGATPAQTPGATPGAPNPAGSAPRLPIGSKAALPQQKKN